jgi:hypothetical protein
MADLFTAPPPADLPRMALSIRQPWAWAIIHAGKDIENRDWSTRFRGPVCIHAAKGCTQEEHHWAARTIAKIGGKEVPDLKSMQRGGIVGVADLIDCASPHASPWFFGQFGFVLRNVRPVTFYPVKGALGIFDWRANIDAGGGNG